MPESMTLLVAVGVIGALFILLLSLLTNNYCRDWFSAVCSAASDWKRWWTATMCIAS